jgi:arylsulfatase A-like enzyme
MRSFHLARRSPLLSLIRQALATGLVLGAAWGAVEALVVLLLPWQRHALAVGRLPPFDVVEALAVMLQAAWRSMPPVLVVAVPMTLALAAVERVILRGRKDDGPSQVAPRAVVSLIAFANLYWWTKPLWAFSWGLPFHHPKRLALSAAWLVAGYLAAVLVVRRDGLLSLPGRKTVAATLLILVLGGGWATWRESALAPEADWGEERPPNVLLVVLDAMRADRLGVMGHERTPPVSPRIDAMAQEGVVFDRAFVQAPFTWTSFGSMLTGKYPREHGLIKMSPDQRLDTARNRTLAQALDEEGYATGAFLTGTLSNNTGLLRGFDTYFETIVGHEPVNRHSRWSVVRSRLLVSVLWNKLRQAMDERLVNTEALDWIGDHADQPFFALVHYYSTHTPYDPPEPYASMYDPTYTGPYHPFFQSHGVWVMKQQQAGACAHDGQDLWSCDHFDPLRDPEHVNALYDGGVAFADDMFGDLLDLLDDEGIADDTLVIFTSDHGEELYDHGIFEHDWMFNTNLLIPLVMRLPGGAHAGARVAWPVEEIDIPLTILDVTGVGRLEEGEVVLPGRSLLADMAGNAPPAPELWAAAENVRYVSLQDERWKIVRNRFTGAFRVFDLVADPDEHCPLDLDDPGHAPVIADLLARLDAYDASQPIITGGGGGEVDIEAAKQLIKLGYTAGLSEETLAAIASGDDESAKQSLLGDTQFVGSNELLEEDLYTQRWQWPPDACDDED